MTKLHFTLPEFEFFHERMKHVKVEKYLKCISTSYINSNNQLADKGSQIEYNCNKHEELYGHSNRQKTDLALSIQKTS